MSDQNSFSVRRLSDQAAGVISYITIFPAIVFLFLHPYCDRPSVRFHAWQSICFNLTILIFSMILSLLADFAILLSPFVDLRFTWAIWLIRAVWILISAFCMFKAAHGQCCMLPVLGSYAAKRAED